MTYRAREIDVLVVDGQIEKADIALVVLYLRYRFGSGARYQLYPDGGLSAVELHYLIGKDI